MRRYKAFVYETAVIWAFLIFVGLFFGLPIWRSLTVDGPDSIGPLAEILGTFLLLAVAFAIFSRLRYWVVWLAALIVLAVVGTGIDLPHRFVLDPAQHSFVGAVLTLVAIIAFRGLEKLEELYTGSDIADAGGPDSLIEDDAILSLNLEGEDKGVTTASKRN